MDPVAPVAPVEPVAPRRKPQLVGNARLKAIADFDKRRKYKAFRIRSRVPVKNQLHLKAILIWYDDRIEFIQFSRNIDTRGPQVEMMYRGLPKKLDLLITLFIQILEKGAEYVDNLNVGASGARGARATCGAS